MKRIHHGIRRITPTSKKFNVQFFLQKKINTHLEVCLVITLTINSPNEPISWIPSKFKSYSHLIVNRAVICGVGVDVGNDRVSVLLTACFTYQWKCVVRDGNLSVSYKFCVAINVLEDRQVLSPCCFKIKIEFSDPCKHIVVI